MIAFDKGKTRKNGAASLIYQFTWDAGNSLWVPDCDFSTQVHSHVLLMSYMPDPCVLYSKSFMEHLLQLLYLLFCFVTKLTYATEALTIKEAALIQ